MSLVKFLKGTEANITKLKSTSSVTEGALYVATDTGTMWLGTSKTSLLQIKDNIDTDTWRGIQNNLTSTSTTDSLSAAQGKILNEKFNSYVPTSRTVNGKALSQNISISASDIGAAASSHTHTKSQITDFPSSLKNPNALTVSLNGTSQGAYDGSSAKKINITASSIGAAASSHTHYYAGSSSVGGSANSAVKLDSNAGSANVPVYFSGGKPTACTAYSQAKVKEAAEEYTVVQNTEDGMLCGGLIPDPGDNRIRIWLCVGDSGQLESVKVYVTE